MMLRLARPFFFILFFLWIFGFVAIALMKGEMYTNLSTRFWYLASSTGDHIRDSRGSKDFTRTSAQATALAPLVPREDPSNIGRKDCDL